MTLCAGSEPSPITMDHYNGSLYNVMVEWETGEITEEPLTIISQDDPVTCDAYGKQHNLLDLPKWRKLRHIAKHQKP